jgi:hypothetical protein
MAYIGKEPIVGNFQMCDAISVVNGQATYALQVGGAAVYPESSSHVLCSLNGILQKSGSSFSISSSNIVFASNLATGDVIDFVMLLGSVLNLQTVSDGTITNAKLAQDLINGETAETSIADADEVLIYDTSASALRKMTKANFTSGVAGTWTSTVTYSTTLTNTSGGDATTTVTGNYHKVGKVYYWSLPNLTRDSTFGGSDVIINKFTLPATANSNSVNSRGIVGGYKMQGRYNTNDLTSDGQVYWSISAGNDYATLVYLQLNSSGTGFVRLNGSGSSAKLAGYFIGA